jgi:hypothetical protein
MELAWAKSRSPKRHATKGLNRDRRQLPREAFFSGRQRERLLGRIPAAETGMLGIPRTINRLELTTLASGSGIIPYRSAGDSRSLICFPTANNELRIRTSNGIDCTRCLIFMDVVEYPDFRKKYQYRKIPKSVWVEIPGLSSVHRGVCNVRFL